MIHPKTHACFLFVLLVVLAAGCDNKVKVRGTVVFEDDQAPLTVGTVLLQSDTHAAKGQIDATGAFRISSVKPGDGVPPGVYRVAILGAIKEPEAASNSETSMGAIEAAVTSPTGTFAEPVPLIKPQYMDPRNSGITFDTSTDKVLNIVVQRPDK